jgi:hypothetical protein
MDKPLSIVLRAVGATQTARDVGKVDSSVSGLTKRAGTFATALRTNVSGAMSTFGGRIKQLIGVGAGFLGVGGPDRARGGPRDSISKAQAWGEASLRLAQITKLPIEMTSKLIDATRLLRESRGSSSSASSLAPESTEEVHPRLGLRTPQQHNRGEGARASRGRPEQASTRRALSASRRPPDSKRYFTSSTTTTPAPRLGRLLQQQEPSRHRRRRSPSRSSTASPGPTSSRSSPKGLAGIAAEAEQDACT